MFALCEVSMAMLVAMCVVWTVDRYQGLVSARQGAPKCVLLVLTLQIIHNA